MNDHPQLALDNQLCFSLYRASRAVTRAYQPLLQNLGLTYPQYLTMLVLWEDDRPHSLHEITQRLGLDSGTLTPVCRRLEQAGVDCTRALVLQLAMRDLGLVQLAFE